MPMYPVYVCIFLVAATGTDFGGGFGFGGPPANSSSSEMNFGFGFGGDSTPTAPQQNNQGPIMLNLKQLSLVVVLLTRVILVPWCFLLRLYTCFWWQYNFRLPKHVLLLLRGQGSSPHKKSNRYHTSAPECTTKPEVT